MTTLRIGTIVAVLSLLALPARAADIGLLGGDFDPAPISDPSVFGFGACNNESGNSIGNEYFDNYRCIFYDFPDLDENEELDEISSIEFFLFGLSGFEFEVDPASDLQGFGAGELVYGALRLFSNNGNIVPNFCEGDYDYIECERITGLALFIGPSEGDPGPLPQDISAQVVAVNGLVTVPEPATLSMLAPGLLAALFFRRRARSGRRT